MSTIQPSKSPEPPSAQRPDPESVSLSGYEIGAVYGPDSVRTVDPDDAGKSDPRIAEPGEFPFTRGVHPTMYRSRLWTMRQFAGFGSASGGAGVLCFKFGAGNATHGGGE